MGTVMQKLLLAITAMFLIVSCNQLQEDLDNVKAYKHENKYFKAGLKSLHFIIETSPIAEVDSVFNLFLQRNDIPIDATGCPNGIYTGESPYDAYDYKHVITIQIENEKIISVDYNEINKSDIGKEEDLDYNEEMKVSGTSPSIAYPKMEKQLLEVQNMNKVDAVSGATYSLYRFRYALAIALMKARLNNQE